MPFNRISVLENVWRHDLQKAYEEGKILQPAAPKKTVKTTVTVTTQNAAPAKTGASKQTAAKAASQPAAAKPAPQKTKINKLQMVPTNGYKGGFN